MRKLDYCIKMQFKMTVGEFLTVGLMLFVAVLPWIYMGFGGSGYVGIWLVGMPGLVAGLSLSFLVLRKIFVRSVYTSSSALYQSLPLTAADLVISKIFTAGIFLLLAFLPAFLIFGNGLGSLYVGKYQIKAAIIQILVNLGYRHSQIPLFVSLALIAAVFGCFAMAAVIQFVIAVYYSSSNWPGKLAAGIVGMVLAILAALGLNLLPYILLLSSGEGAVAHTAMMPAAGILLNVGVLLAAGKGSVRLLER